MQRIIYGGGGAGLGAELAYVDCVRESAELMNLGCLAPVFEAPGAFQARNKFPEYVATMPHRGDPSPTRFPRALLYGL